jgi:hypothetical protein
MPLILTVIPEQRPGKMEARRLGLASELARGAAARALVAPVR